MASLSDVRTDLKKILGDAGAQGFTTANMNAAINWSCSEAARMLECTRSRKTLALASGQGAATLPVPVMRVDHVELVQP